MNVPSLKRLGLRSCGTCAKAKIKCVPGEQGRSCERCVRLGKECGPPVASRKRQPVTQIARLEKKVDSLVTLLGSNGVATEASVSALGSLSDTPPRETDPSLLARQTPGPSVATISNEFDSLAKNTPLSSFHNSDQASIRRPSSSDPFDLEVRAAEALVTNFRENMCGHMPFVIIPRSWDSEDFRKQRPCLWKAVITAASYGNTTLQQDMGWNLMEDISTRMLLKAEKSLDLLQAILVHMMWYHYHAISNPQVTNLLHLAQALVTNLGYHRMRSVKDRRQLFVHGVDGAEQPIDYALDLTTIRRDTTGTSADLSGVSQTFEEWRAMAGLFFFNSVAVAGCRRIDPMIYTAHVQNICRRLAEAHEYESDKMIIHLCRMQNIVLKISGIFDDPEDNNLAKVPVQMQTTILQDELDTFMQNLPEAFKESNFIQVKYQIAQVCLYEVGLYNNLNTGSSKIHRLSTLHACLVAVKSLLESQHTSFYGADVSYGQWIKTNYVLLMGFKLCLCVADGWDLEYVRQALDLVRHLDYLVGKLEVIVQFRAKTLKDSGETEVFARYLREMKKVKVRYLALVGEGSGVEVLQSPQGGMEMEVDEQGWDADEVMKSIDDDFWRSLFSDTSDEWMMNGSCL